MCRVKSMWELRWSSSSQSRWLLWREAMAASRKKAAFSAVGARSSLWFWSCSKHKREMNQKLPHKSTVPDNVLQSVHVVSAQGSDGTDKEKVYDGMRHSWHWQQQYHIPQNGIQAFEGFHLEYLWWQVLHTNPSNWKPCYGLHRCRNLFLHFPRILSYLCLFINIFFTAPYFSFLSLALLVLAITACFQ